MNWPRRPIGAVRRMSRLGLKTRLAVYLAVFVSVFVVFTIGYWYGMAALEGRERSFVEAIQIVAQSMTTTGYGQDAPWQTATMNLFTVLMQLTGILLLFMALPLFVVPWVQQVLGHSYLDDLGPLTDHIVVAGHNSLVDEFVAELESHGHEHSFVIVEPDRERAAALHARHVNVLHGDPATEAALETASIDQARAAVVAGGEDHTLNVGLAISDVAPDLPIAAVVWDLAATEYLHAAGISDVFEPERLIGQTMATHFVMDQDAASDEVVLLGHGIVGSTARIGLERWGADPVVVDLEAGEHVDITGDATRVEVLQEAGIPQADVAMITVDEDRTAAKVTLLVRDLNPEVEILVRVTDSGAAGRLRRAGANYILELPVIAGRMIAAAVLDEPISTVHEDVQIERVRPDGTPVREEGNIVGIVRGEEFILDPSPPVELEVDDIVAFVRQ